MALQQFATLAQKKPFPEAAAPLAKMAKDKQADALSVRLVAIQALAKVGGSDAGPARWPTWSPTRRRRSAAGRTTTGSAIRPWPRP